MLAFHQSILQSTVHKKTQISFKRTYRGDSFYMCYITKSGDETMRNDSNVELQRPMTKFRGAKLNA